VDARFRDRAAALPDLLVVWLSTYAFPSGSGGPPVRRAVRSNPTRRRASLSSRTRAAHFRRIDSTYFTSSVSGSCRRTAGGRRRELRGDAEVDADRFRMPMCRKPFGSGGSASLPSRRRRRNRCRAGRSPGGSRRASGFGSLGRGSGRSWRSHYTGTSKVDECPGTRLLTGPGNAFNIRTYVLFPGEECGSRSTWP